MPLRPDMAKNILNFFKSIALDGLNFVKIKLTNRALLSDEFVLENGFH